MSILLHCPNCESTRTTVLDVRARGDNKLRRRRECKDCSHRFTTIEAIVPGKVA